MNTPGDAQAAGDGGLSVDEAASRFEAMLADDGDSTDEALTDEESDPEDEPEPEEGDEDAEGESDEDEDQEGDEEQPRKFRVKVEDAEKEVTLDELIRGYQTYEDYTRKTMALGEERKSFDAEKAEVARERETYAALLPQLRAFIEGQQEDPAELERLRQTDPGEYAARMEEKRQRQEQLNAVTAEEQRLAQQADQDALQTLKSTIETERGELIKAVPAWKDPAKFEAGYKEIRDYATKNGFKPEEIALVYDHRTLLMARKAMMFDRLQDKSRETRAVVETVKAAKPGARGQQPTKVTEITRSKQRLAKTGRVEDAASVFLKMLPD